MFLTILRHEWRCLAADRTLPWTAALFALIVAYAVWNGSAWARSADAERAAGEAETKSLMRDLRAKAEVSGVNPDPFGADPGSPRYVGGRPHNVFLPRRALATLSVGQADLLPSKVGATIWTQKRLLTWNYEVQNPLNLAAGRFDLAFAIVYLFPLLILALSYNLLSGEREAGTLSLMLSQPVGLQTIVWAKVTMRFLFVAGLSAALSFVGLSLSGASVLGGGDLPHVALWTLLVVLYSAFWFSLAVAVGAAGKGSAANAVVLVSIWLVLVAVVPALMNLGITMANPVPPRSLLIQATREASNDVQRAGSRLLAKYFEDHPELLPPGTDPDFSDFTVRNYTVQKNLEAAVAPVLGQYEGQLMAQQRAVNSLRFLSPAVVLQEAFNEIAGTGLSRYQRFREAAWRFVEERKLFFFPRVFRKQRLAASDYAAMPSFRFDEEPFSRVAGRVALGATGLFLPAVALAAWAAALLRHYPVSAS